jgi:type IV pilus assembly protein PilC
MYPLGNIFSRVRWGAFFVKRRLNCDWKAKFFHQMYTLLDAGISVEQAISILVNGCERNSLEYSVFSGLLSKICTGRSLSEAMAAFKDKFSYAEINVIRAAERVGQPQRAIKHLCDFSKTMSHIRRKIVSAMVYPCIVLTVALCVLSILSVVVIPQFQALFFDQMHCGELPMLTRAVVAVCTFFREHIPLLSISLFGVFFCLKFLPRSRRSVILGKLPIVPSLVREYNLCLFANTLSMLLMCNVQLQESLSIAQNVTFDGDLSRRLSRAVERISHGEPLSDSMAGVLSSFAIGLILVGERTGSLGTSLAEVANLCRDNLTAKLETIVATIEPLLIVALAVIVGTVIVALLLPMADVMQKIGVS